MSTSTINFRHQKKTAAKENVKRKASKTIADDFSQKKGTTQKRLKLVRVEQPKAPTLGKTVGEKEADALARRTWDDADEDEIVLRKFDLNVKWGPCSGLSRRERWLRAEKFGDNPPQHILDILDNREAAGQEQGESLFFDVAKRCLEEERDE